MFQHFINILRNGVCLMKKLSVACLFGGNSTEYEVSCRSFYSVLKNIDEEKFNIIKVGIDRGGVWYIYEGEDAKIAELDWIDDSENLYPCAIMPKLKKDERVYLYKIMTHEKIAIDVILPIIHGANGEDGTIQGLAQLYGIPCAGADVAGSACSFDKSITKAICSRAGINQGKYISCRKYQYDKNPDVLIENAEEIIKYPMFVKPANAGSSVGISKAKDKTALKQAIAEAFKYDSKILIEQFMDGREIEIAVLGNNGDLTVSCCGEIDPGAEFYDYAAKYISDTAEYFIPARLDKEVSEAARDIAKQVYMLLGVNGFARVDFFVAADNTIYFNEINTIPGCTEISLFAKLLMHGGMTYREIVTAIIELAIDWLVELI